MKLNQYQLITTGLLALTACSGLALTSTHIYADDNYTDTTNITVPESCSMTGTVNTAHTATLNPGIYSGDSTDFANGIGKTTLTTFCNDNNGFSVYAVGFTGDTEGTNTLVGTNTNLTINTGVYSSGDTTSSWAMKVDKVDNPQSGDPITWNPQNMTIQEDAEGYFNTWHTVPDDYTKVAEYKATTGTSTTDTALGAKLETTYAAYISQTQAADTYAGKVKYVMVHPYNTTAPVKPEAPISQCTTPVPNVTYMQDVTNANLASVLASMDMNEQYYLRDKRDETPYCVSKLDDGSETGTLWMTQNLRIQGTITAALSNFEGADFNVSEYDLKTDGTSGGACYNTSATTGGYYHVCSHTPDSSEIPSGKTAKDIGAWYNYMAVTAGTISGYSNTTEATKDICPANWHLPNYDTNNTVGSVNSISNASSSATKTAFQPVTGGYYDIGSIYSAGSGYWWSSTAFSSRGRYGLYYNGSSLGADNNYRLYGMYVRCVR